MSKPNVEGKVEETKRVKKRRERWSWEIFVGCMFVGIGLGILVGETGAFTMFGMGIGFILASLIRFERAKFVITVPRSVGSAVVIAIGLLLILLGLNLMGVVTIEITKLVAGFVLILLGAAVMLIGLRISGIRIE
ncbi:MAG: hypothetical protein DRJ40_00135 [Thermoprotei archaeon]|nr:MAG: hypothetical protein DRJ40_00135 [Thermoprotei archaeon]